MNGTLTCYWINFRLRVHTKTVLKLRIPEKVRHSMYFRFTPQSCQYFRESVVEKVNDELGRIWNKADVPNSWNYSGFFL
jgi:hypothetical protein